MMTSKIPFALIAALIILIFSGSGFAQNSNAAINETDQPELKHVNNFIITESHYHCFRDLNCLKNNNDIRNSGLKINFETAHHYNRFTLHGESANEKVHAVYGDNGRLIEARLVRVDIALPKFITEQIATGQYEGWQMIGNEMAVENFNAKTTQYKVILQKDNRGTVLYFDRHGNRLNQFAGL